MVNIVVAALVVITDGALKLMVLGITTGEWWQTGREERRGRGGGRGQPNDKTTENDTTRTLVLPMCPAVVCRKIPDSLPVPYWG